MIDAEQLIRHELESSVLAYRGLDWDEVLARADVRRRRPRRGRVVAAAASAVAVAAAVLLALSPWTVSPSFADRSLAAVGNGRWVFAVIQTRAAYTRVVDLGTGREAPMMLQTMVAYDADTAAHLMELQPSEPRHRRRPRT